MSLIIAGFTYLYLIRWGFFNFMYKCIGKCKVLHQKGGENIKIGF